MNKFSKEQQAIFSAANHFLPKGAWVAGGALTSVYTGLPVNDVDIYFNGRKSFEDAVHRAYDDGFWCVAKTSRAVTFVYGTHVIQLMHFNWFDAPSSIFDSFDFTCCMAAMDCETKDIVMHEEFLKHCSQRFLKFHSGTAFPYGTVSRVLKYQKRGYTIGVNEMLRIALKCSSCDINTWDDLKEQIGGQYGESVNLNRSGDFTIDAAIEAMKGMQVVRSSNDPMPDTPDELIKSIFGE